MCVNEIINEIKRYSDEEFAKWTSPILQVTEGGYGSDDKLLGVRVPLLRKVAKSYADVSYDVVQQLLNSEYHEVRMTALLILILKYKKDKHDRASIIEMYISNADYINNWDLVDVSAPAIVGNYVYENREKLPLLYSLSDENHLWKQRIAIVATQYLIKNGFFEPTICLSEKYLTHPHHLIHKAVGWMLRELGKKDLVELFSFLDKYAHKMPRVMLRYSLERVPEEDRKHYMSL